MNWRETMEDQILSFRQLISPLAPETFFGEYFGKKPIHLEGDAARYNEIFSWQDLNALLRMTTIWSDKSMELAMHGRTLPAQAYCYEGTNRDNIRSMRPDFTRVRRHLREGASLALNFIGRLTPGLRSMSQTFESVLCAPVNITTFCSWQQVAAYPSHFDTTSVFVCQISGTKTWHLYEGRMENAAHSPGGAAGDFPQEHHERAKGALVQTLDMKPGDLLYIPHGLYHDAVASSEASLHISMAARHLVAHDFINVLVGDLPKDPLFREHLPHIDLVGASGAYRKRMAARLQEIIEAPEVTKDLRRFLKGKAFEGIAEFDLPQLEECIYFRVRWMHFRLESKADGGQALVGPKVDLALDEGAATLVAWALERDYFSSVLLARSFAQLGSEGLAAWLETMQRCGLIEQM
jgi:ribosomal protein L16 Arg81 hydroxylase